MKIKLVFSFLLLLNYFTKLVRKEYLIIYTEYYIFKIIILFIYFYYNLNKYENINN